MEIKSLSALTWRDFLHDLKAGDIKQVCIVSAAKATSEEILEARPKRAESKSVREESFATRSRETFRASRNPTKILLASVPIYSRRKFPLSFQWIVNCGT